MKIGNRDFVIGKRTYIMGILNVTPDSFSDGGQFNNKESAIRRALEMIEQGADIIDIGGESTRPNHEPVSEEEEIDRVISIIRALKAEIDAPISIDTYKAKVAELALQEGASMINDVWGFKKDCNMAGIAAKYGVPCCLMHNRGEGGFIHNEKGTGIINMSSDPTNYGDIILDMLAELTQSIDIALQAGVKRENIIIDPGIGFAKNSNQNEMVINRLEELNKLGFPILLAASRKSFIGNILDLPPEQRVEGTIATTVIGIMKGIDFIRVHDILANKRACLVADAIVRR